MPRPALLISAGDELFASFFSPRQQQMLGRRFHWERNAAGKMTADFKRNLATSEALITTWDSPRFSDDLPQLAPRLRIIAHCGGEVKSRFPPSLFKRITITNAPIPMARATAELG